MTQKHLNADRLIVVEVYLSETVSTKIHLTGSRMLDWQNERVLLNNPWSIEFIGISRSTSAREQLDYKSQATEDNRVTEQLQKFFK